MYLMLADINRYGIGNATWIELVWITVGVTGTYNMLMLFIAALGDRDFLKREGINGTRSIVAQSSVITLGAKVIVLVGYAAVGLVAASQAPVNPNRQYTTAGVVITVAFLVGTLALNGAALYQRRARNRVLAIEAAREREYMWNGIDRRNHAQ
jgi:hypothetical protein